MSVSIDPDAFKRRAALIQSLLEKNDASALVTVLSRGDEETEKQTANLLHMWLLGWPFANTAIIIGRNKTWVAAAAKQVRHLGGLKSREVEVVVRGKEAAGNQELLQGILAEAAPENAKTAVFSGDHATSEIAAPWQEIIDARPEKVDLTAEFTRLLEIKDDSELRSMLTGSKLVSGIMKNLFAEEMMRILDEGRQVPISSIESRLSRAIDDDAFLKKLKLPSNFDPSYVDWAAHPQVNEGRQGNLGPGVILCELVSSYKGYCSPLARTFLVDTPKEQIQQYQIVLGAQRAAIDAIRDGAKCADVYEATAAHLREKNPELKVDNVGFGIGLKAENPDLALKEGNTTVLRDGMTLCVRINTGGLLLADTVRVTSDGALVFTDAPQNRSDIAFMLADVKPEPVADRRERLPRAARDQAKREAAENAEAALQKHQGELKRRLQEAGQAKYRDAALGEEGDQGPHFKKFESYKRETQLPKLENLRLTVDHRAQTVLVPISGRPVPFHINTYKNGNATEEGEYTYVRLNFNSPDSNVARRDDVPYDNPLATFVKSVTLRSRDGERMRESFRQIQELKRETTRREKEREQMADVVQQENLVEQRERRPPRLEPVQVRPAPEGRKVAGSLEIHKNGLRYSSALKEQTVDVLFSNIKHLFFQPCDHEVMVIIHAHLVNPIVIGKRKTQDVQFFREAIDVSYDDTGNRKRRYRYGDEDEIEQEQEERRLRKQLNREFHAFAEQIARATGDKIDVDVPFRELGFNGVPFRSNVYLQPTRDCLVQLSEMPFLVVTLSEVEVAVLERVRFGLRQFDLVLVNRDFKKAPVSITAIPVTQLDAVKQWLDSVDIPFYEAELNYNWKEIMGMISGAPHEFFVNDGGWSFLDPASDEDEEAPEEEEDEFEVSDDNPQDESDFSEGGGSEDFDDEEEDDFEPEEELEEEAADWSDLEEEAMQEDRKREKQR